MAVTFVLGRAGAGKTRFCSDAVAAELANEAVATPTSGSRGPRAILIVPEQASFQTERNLALSCARRGYWRAEVLTFSRLAQRVLDEAGECEPLSPSARRMALRRLAIKQPARLDAFGAAARTPGFFSQLARLIEELLAEDVAPDELRRAAERLAEPSSRTRVAQIARFYGDYLAWLGPARLDPRQRVSRMRALIERTPWLQGAAIWVDGFAGFSGQEAAALVALARAAAQVHITLLIDPDAPAPAAAAPLDQMRLFRRTRQTYSRLARVFAEAQIEVAPPIRLSRAPLPRFARFPEGARLEAGLALLDQLPGAASPPVPETEARARPAPAGNVRIIECASHRQELQQAARSIRIRMADGGVRFRDFAIIVRELEPYAALIADVLEDYEIPYFIDRRRPLSAHALPRFILSLLEALEFDLPPATAADLLGADLLPLSSDDARRLDLMIHRHALRGFDAWRRARWQFDDHRERYSLEAEFLAKRRQDAMRHIEPLLKRARAVRTPTGAEWARELYETLRRLGVRREINRWISDARHEERWDAAESHRQAWDGLVAVLDDLHVVLADTPIELAELSQLMSAALREQTLATPPPTLDQVLVSSVDRSRHPDIRHAWILAFNEGVFPARPAEDPLLGPAERRQLLESGLAGPAGHADDVFDERLLAYIAMTRPSQTLTISYARTDVAGEESQPSPLLADLRAIIPEIRIERPDADSAPVCVSEFARGALAAHAEGRSGLLTARFDPLESALMRDAAVGERVARALRGRSYANRPDPLRPYREEGLPAGAAWRGSPTRLEVFIDCPFKHFAKYWLRLETQRVPRSAPLELGSWAHELLAGAVRRAIDEACDARRMSDDQWRAQLQEAVDAAPRLPHPPDREFLRRVQIRRVEDVLLAHAARWRRGALTPVAIEQAFEAERPGAWPELELALPGGERIRITGKIDRVDTLATAAGELVVIYDYKSTPPAAMKNFKWLARARFQLFTYLLAAVEARRAAAGDVVSAGVLVAPLAPRQEALEGNPFSAADEQLMYLYRPQGVFDALLADALDSQQPTNSPVAGMRRKKNGGFYANSDVRSADAMTRWLDLTRRTILHAAQGILDGCIDISPLVEERTFACTRCDFKPVCRFEREINRARPAGRSLPVLAGDDEGEADRESDSEYGPRP